MATVKNISIKSFLAERGIFPRGERGGYGMYLSPLREEQIPSFKVDGLAAARATESQPSEIHHRHTMDIGLRKVFISLIVMGLLIFILTCALINQCLVTDKFRDSDLKYRYIQMRGETTPDEIGRLRKIFEFNRNRDSIRIIRKQVAAYEHLVQQQAESTAHTHLNTTQANKLQSQAEAVKDKR